MSCHAWCTINPLMKAYHDQEWGQALLDENRLLNRAAISKFGIQLGGGASLHRAAA